MADAKDSSAMSMVPKSSPKQQQLRNLLMAQDILRILAILFSASSIAIMVTNNQTVIIFSLPFEAHFYYSSAFKFLVAANGVVCGFSVLTLIFSFLMKHQISQRKDFHFFLFTHDIVMTVLLISACGAATAIGYVGQFGEEHMGWQPLCNHVHKFCKTNLISLLVSYFVVVAYLGLTLLTAYKFVSFSPNS